LKILVPIVTLLSTEQCPLAILFWRAHRQFSNERSVSRSLALS
jgi:hypothetical protein